MKIHKVLIIIPFIISLVYCPLTPADSMSSGTVDIYSNELKTSLINMAKFDIYHPKDQLKSLEEVTLDKAIQIGLESGTDFVLFGTVSEIGENIRIHITMINPRIGTEVLAINTQTNLDMYRYDFKRLALEIEQASMVASELALEYIKAYMEYGNYEKAQSALRNYVSLKKTTGVPLTPEEQEIRKQVNLSLSQVYTDEAERFLEADFFLEAQIRNKKALELDPDNEAIKSQNLKITARLEEYQGQELTSNLAVINGLILREDYLSAMALIDNMENNGIQSLELSTRKAEVSLLIKAERAYENAKSYFRENDFDNALYEIETAILLNSKRVEYKALQIEITKKKNTTQRNEEKWLNYEDEFDRFNKFSLFLKPKSPQHMESLSYTKLTISWKDSEGTLLNDNELVLKGVGLRESWFFANPIPSLTLPFSSLSGGFMAGMGLLLDQDRTTYATNSSLNTQKWQTIFLVPIGGEMRFAWYQSDMVQLGFIYHWGSLLQDQWELAEWQQFDLMLGIKVY